MNKYERMSDDYVETSWCYMPPEMHFSSPQDLKEAIWAFELSRIQDILNGGEPGLYFLPPVGKFERVRDRNGKYILLPVALDYSFVFRGQTQFYGECLPTLYRNNRTEAEIMLERLRCCEFEVYLKQLPQVEDFEKHKFNIDYLGLAQHYGLYTNVIDLTSSLDVAFFFAMCNMSADGKCFYPQRDDREYIGYIYIIGTSEFGGSSQNVRSLFEGKLNAIGMQPFYRPGSQRGFGMHLEKGETLTGLLYSFSYTKADSEMIYRKFHNGDVLWHEDDISRVAGEIKEGLTFSYKAMNLCLSRYCKGTKQERLSMKRTLLNMGCVFKSRSCWEIDRKTLQAIKVKYLENGGFGGLSNIISRNFLEGGTVRKSCIDTKVLASMQMIGLPVSGCPAPDDYKSPYCFFEYNDGNVWGFSFKRITQEEQTKPNMVTGKVEKWTGDWRSLEIDYNREKKLKMRVVDNR